MIEEQSSNIVLVPVGAQIAQLNQLWLYKQGILGEDAQGLFTPVAVQAGDAELDLLLLPNRIQFTAKGQNSLRDGWSFAAERLRKLLDAGAPMVGPLTGLGLNAQAFWSTGDRSDGDTMIERALVPSEKLLGAFVQDRQMGLSVLERFDGIVLTTKIDSAKNMVTDQSGIGVDCNVHAELQDGATALNFLSRIDDLAARVEARFRAVEMAVLGGGI